MKPLRFKTCCGMCRDSLEHCKNLLDTLVTLLDCSNDYLEVFGIPIDTTVKGAIISFVLAAVTACIMAVGTLVVGKMRFHTGALVGLVKFTSCHARMKRFM